MFFEKKLINIYAVGSNIKIRNKIMTRSEAGKLGAIKSAQIQKHQKELRIQAYNKNPKLCKNCGKPIPYEKRKFSNCSVECGKQIKTKHNHIYVCPFCNEKILGKNNILNHKR
jgi:ribosomal protein L37AE/L43A